ncbi:MAG: hypothetical protein KAI79_18290 [Bacteroidales bacterium]|nr:hypothetical protein [Bacteroidales bacterium]
MSNFEDQYNLPFNASDKIKNIEIDSKAFASKINELANFENGRLESFVSFLNREYFEDKFKFEDLRKKVLEVFGGESPFLKDREDVDVVNNDIDSRELIDDLGKNNNNPQKRDDWGIGRGLPDSDLE